MIISSMTKLVKLGKNLKSHLSPSLSDAAACDTLSMAGMLSSHALHQRETSAIPATLTGQITSPGSNSFHIIPHPATLAARRGGGRGREGESCHSHV